jgi:hypothetical protein
MIDLTSEDLIAFSEAAKHVPGRPHLSTLHRWARRRHRALETIKVGGRIFTSVEAVSRFVQQRGGAEAALPPSADRARQIARAEAVLDAARV